VLWRVRDGRGLNPLEVRVVLLTYYGLKNIPAQCLYLSIYIIFYGKSATHLKVCMNVVHLTEIKNSVLNDHT
jgi:hypothetical protein